MARIIVTTENTHLKLMDEQMDPKDLKSVQSSERLLEKIEWSVAEAWHADKKHEVV